MNAQAHGRASGFLAAFVDDLLTLDLGPVTDEERERTRGWVLERVAGAGSITRAGLGATGIALSAAVRARTGSRYADLPPDRRRAIADRLLTTAAPLVSEYARAVRALAVAYLYDLRHASAP